MVQAFRRQKSPHESGLFQLRGLKPDASYTIQNTDAVGSTQMTGRELMKEGLAITIAEQPGAVVITYRKETTKPEADSQTE